MILEYKGKEPTVARVDTGRFVGRAEKRSTLGIIFTFSAVTRDSHSHISHTFTPRKMKCFTVSTPDT